VSAETSTTPGYRAIIGWSARVHGVGGARHRWAIEAAQALDAGGLGVKLPPFPSHMKYSPAAMDETVRRLYRTAGGAR
jgi:hypothetical protein